MKVTSQAILKWAKANNLILADYARNWKVEKPVGKVAIENPVTCIQKVQEKKLQTIISSLILLAAGLWASAIGMPILLVLVIGTGGVALYRLDINQRYPKAQQEWRKKNAAEFITAMEIATRGAVFIDYKGSDQDSLNQKQKDWQRESRKAMVDAILQDEAKKVKVLQDLPWRLKEAKMVKLKFESLHKIMRQLLPELPKKYDAYFA